MVLRVKPLAFSAVLGGLAVGCASGQTECHPATWSGTCQLIQTTKIRESEFPLPNVTLEAVYRPQPPPGGPTLVPGDARREFSALSKFEEALRAYIEAHPTAQCYINPPAPGQCNPGPMVVEVPDFDASQAQATSPDSGPKGCAQIEAASAQDKLHQNRSGARVIEQRFEFAENSAEPSSAAASDLDALATLLKQTPSLQCVAVVGAWVRGESVAVAFARARAIREQLIGRGVPAERMLALTVDPTTVGVAGVPEAPNPRDRRVTISVLLDLPSEE